MAKRVGREPLRAWLGEFVNEYCQGKTPFRFEGETCFKCRGDRGETEHGCRRNPLQRSRRNAYTRPGNLFDDDLHIACDEGGGRLCPELNDVPGTIIHETMHHIADTYDQPGQGNLPITQDELDGLISELCQKDDC
jgi:hypothetical protein